MVSITSVCTRQNMNEGDGMTYSGSGVDIDAESSAVASLIGSLANSTREKGTLGAPVKLEGGFGGLIEFGPNWLALATDGVGSKLQIANSLSRYEGVGMDCVAMNVNDLLCVGAEPLAFVDYIAVPRPSDDAHSRIGRSLSEACRRANVTLAGGETATLPGIVTELDLSGTALGWLPSGMAITGEAIAPGDVLIGFPSSGLHSNGFSLVRDVVSKSGVGLTDPCPFPSEHGSRSIEFDQGDLGSVLLNPTRIYVDPIVSLLFSERSVCARDKIHGIAHITGGGLSNLLRLSRAVGFVIDDPLEPHPEFEWIGSVGNVSDWEMHRVFNMGMGMVVVADRTVAPEVVEWARERVPGTKVVGRVTEGGEVVHTPLNLRYDQY